MKKFTSILLIAAVFLAVGSPAAAQLADSEEISGSPLEVTEDGKLIYGGDVAYECESVGSGIVMPAANSNRATRAELERTNERAIELCTQAGFPPPDGENAAEDLAADEEGNLVGSPSPPLEVKRDGTLVIGGDSYAANYCRLLKKDPEQVAPKGEDYVEACEKAGFSTSAGRSTLLPETGGVNVTVIVFVASIAAGSILAHRIFR